MFTQLYKKIRLLKHKNKEPYSSLYKILGFYPDNIHVYEQAFLHKSSSVEASDGKWLNNERLEFLGDAVLDAVVADYFAANSLELCSFYCDIAIVVHRDIPPNKKTPEDLLRV